MVHLKRQPQEDELRLDIDEHITSWESLEQSLDSKNEHTWAKRAGRLVWTMGQAEE